MSKRKRAYAPVTKSKIIRGDEAWHYGFSAAEFYNLHQEHHDFPPPVFDGVWYIGAWLWDYAAIERWIAEKGWAAL